jgi:hypothetical protein
MRQAKLFVNVGFLSGWNRPAQLLGSEATSISLQLATGPERLALIGFVFLAFLARL